MRTKPCQIVVALVMSLLVPVVAAAQTPTEAQLVARVAQDPRSVGPLLDLAKFYSDRQMLAQAEVTVRQALTLLEQQMRIQGVPRQIAPEPPPPPPVSLATTGALRVGGDVRQPKQVTRVEPVYPEDAKAAGVSGLVILEVLLDKDGRVKQATVLRHVLPSIDQAALNAVRQWTYSPTLLNGVPVEVAFTVTLNFTLSTP